MTVFSLAREARNAGQANATDDNEIIGSDDKTATATTRSAITLRTPKQCTENVFEARRCYLREIYATTINLRLVDIQQPIYRRSLAGTLSNRPLYIERCGFDHPAQLAGALLCR